VQQQIICHPASLAALQDAVPTTIARDLFGFADMALNGIPVITDPNIPEWETKWHPPKDKFVSYDESDEKLFTMKDHKGLGIGPAGSEFNRSRVFFMMERPEPRMASTDKLFRALDTIWRRNNRAVRNTAF
jgi:hypothetical protein